MRYIYVITNTLDGKVYVGQTKDPKMRWRTHLASMRTTYVSHLKNALLLHGFENFSFEVIEECADDQVDERECYWIDRYAATDPLKGYNKYRGRLVHHCHTPESRQKISAAMKNRYFSPEHRRKLSEASKGRKHTIEARQKMSDSKKGRIPEGLPERQARIWSGEGNPRATTTREIAEAIRTYATENPTDSAAAIARKFDLSYKVAYYIIKGWSYQ